MRGRRWARLTVEPDLFYFLQCATTASPGDPLWPVRVKEERYALWKYAEFLRYTEGKEAVWFEISPTGPDARTWAGKVRARGRVFPLEMVLKDAYPEIPPAARVPGLIEYTDRKLEDPVLGERICDMHMEANYWWNAHSGISLYLKREVSYWLTAVVHSLSQAGYM